MRSPTLVRSKHRDGSVGSSSCGAHSLATSKLRGQSVSTEDTKPWWMTSWQSHGPTRAGSCLSDSWWIATRSSAGSDVRMSLSRWTGSCLYMPFLIRAKCSFASDTSGHWREAGAEALPVWLGCLPGSWCLSRICWFAAIASLWRSTCNGQCGRWTSPVGQGGERDPVNLS